MNCWPSIIRKEWSSGLCHAYTNLQEVSRVGCSIVHNRMTPLVNSEGKFHPVLECDYCVLHFSHSDTGIAGVLLKRCCEAKLVRLDNGDLTGSGLQLSLHRVAGLVQWLRNIGPSLWSCIIYPGHCSLGPGDLMEAAHCLVFFQQGDSNAAYVLLLHPETMLFFCGEGYSCTDVHADK